MSDLLIVQVAAILLYASVWFLVAQRLRRYDIADIAWGLGFIVLAFLTRFSLPEVSIRGLVVLGFVTVWGLRLALHIWSRNRSGTEDPRYRKWREEWGSHANIRAYFQLFLFQGILIVVILTPVTHILSHQDSDFRILDVAGAAVWMVGFIFETVGDFQLARFKRNPNNRGRIIRSGLWKYTRHPNYFGEVILWWGVWLIACSVPGGWVTAIGPATITVLILFVSGIPLLEKRYEGNTEFEEYRQRTSAFFPFPPKR
ncbi:MAG: DUF1295 domain-containing protein [Acidobacteriota bacterium]|jgi:steroid 5-alpha reductase family enzyme